MATDTNTLPKPDGTGTDTDKKPDGFDADAVRKKIDSFSGNQLVDDHIGANKRIYDLNQEIKDKRERADATLKELDEIKKEIEDSTNKGLEDNKKFEELYNKEKEKTEKFDFYKKFHDDQIDIINGQIGEMEGKLSNQSKELYDVFKGNENITPTEKLKFLSKAMVESGIDVDRSQSKGGAKLDPKTATLTEKMEHFKRTGKNIE